MPRTFWRILAAAALATGAAGISAITTGTVGCLRHSTTASVPGSYMLLFFTLWAVLGIGAVVAVWRCTRERPRERLVLGTRMYRIDPDNQEQP